MTALFIIDGLVAFVLVFALLWFAATKAGKKSERDVERIWAEGATELEGSPDSSSWPSSGGARPAQKSTAAPHPQDLPRLG